MESCVDQTLAAALPDYGDQADDSGEVFAVDIAQIPKSLEKDDKSVKMLIRSHGLSVMREERKHFWKGIYNKRESVENIEANRRLYWETVKTCFGSIGMTNIWRISSQLFSFQSCTTMISEEQLSKAS